VTADGTAATVSHVGAEEDLLDGLRRARAQARERGWARGARPAGPLIIDLDATLVTAHSDKDAAAGTFKGGFGYHPLLAYLDGPDLAGGDQPLAALLRPATPAPIAPPTTSPSSRMRSSTPARRCQRRRDRRALRLGRGHARAAGFLPTGAWASRSAWTHAAGARRDPRVAGIGVATRDRRRRPHPRQRAGRRTHRPARPLRLADGIAVLVRRERPHPGAQLSFTDADGYRFQAILTDQRDPEIAVLERRHRERARVDDRIRRQRQRPAEPPAPRL